MCLEDRKREEYWDTQPHYGGDRVIWDALKAACDEPNPNMAATILDSAGVIVSKADLSECYDAKGFKYELPKFVVAPPQNLRPEIKAAVREATAPETARRNPVGGPAARPISYRGEEQCWTTDNV
ncbi:hypothetical protein WJX81_007321 [Elliptochloris bilobata]|uniref:DC-UbP/UBTD2 N-terminal domain-containing protein n=1 Tax=Elliptochloris bilobata TaxID=381761 RepID=A0AAW1R4C9_9CHLO